MQNYTTIPSTAHNDNRAINNLKQVMFAVKYMQIAEVAALLVKEAARVETYFDDIETKLAAITTSKIDNSATYQKLQLGDARRKYVYAQYSLANSTQADFLSMWVPRIVATHLGTTGNTTGGGQQSAGVQTNPTIIKRIKGLQAAYNSFLQTPWKNPFPPEWA